MSTRGPQPRGACPRRRPRDGVPGEYRWEASLLHMTGTATEAGTRAVAQWIASQVRPGRRHRPPTGRGLRRKHLRRLRKSLAGCYYQLLLGHAAMVYLKEGPEVRRERALVVQQRQPQSGRRHVTSSQARAPQIRKLCKA